MTKSAVLAARKQDREGKQKKKKGGERKRGGGGAQEAEEGEVVEEDGDGDEDEAVAGFRVEPVPASLAAGDGGGAPGGAGAGEEDGGSRPEDVARQQQEDNRVLAAVFGGKGLAGVLSHDAVERGRMQDVDSWMRVQEQARRIADVRVVCLSVCAPLCCCVWSLCLVRSVGRSVDGRIHPLNPPPALFQPPQRAAAALRESSAAVQAARAANPFAPTWTGRVGSAGNGHNNGGGQQPPPLRFGARASAAAAAAGGGNGLLGVGGAGAAASSADILARFRDREGVGGGGSANGGGGTDARFVSLLEKIQIFLRDRGGRASTGAVLHHFSWVANNEAVVFKQLLKRAAAFDKAGKAWVLREEEEEG